MNLRELAIVSSFAFAALLNASCNPLGQLQRQLDDVRRQVTQTTEAVTEAGNKIQALQEKLDTAVDAASDSTANARKALEEKLSQLQQENEALTSRLEQLREEEQRLEEVFSRPR